MKVSASVLLALAFTSLSAAAAVPQMQELLPRKGIADIAEVGAKIAQAILEASQADQELRERFAVNMIDGFRREYGDATNIVVCHSGYETNWNGDQGNAWDKWHYDLDVQIGDNVGYDMFVSKVGGYFKRFGDGGNNNWAWRGFLAKDPEEDGSRITFVDTGDL